jgi:hypothetical protein
MLPTGKKDKGTALQDFIYSLVDFGSAFPVLVIQGVYLLRHCGGIVFLLGFGCFLRSKIV